MTATLSTHNQAQFEKAVRIGIDKLNEFYGINVPYPTVRWSLTGRGTLGKVSLRREGGVVKVRYIALHKGYATQLGAEYLDTVLHEVCHVVTTFRCGGRFDGRWSPHGTEWKNAMRALGLRPDRLATVSAEVVQAAATPRKVTRVTVSCTCKSYSVTPQKAAKVTSSGVICANCRTPFWRMK